MNKKGFTLTELLAVIVVLAIIISIAMMSSTSIMNKSKNKLYCEMQDNLKDVAITYYLDTKNDTVTVGKLIEDGYFEDNKAYCDKTAEITISIEKVNENDSSTDAATDYVATVPEGTCGNVPAKVCEK